MREIMCRAYVEDDIIEGHKAQMYTVLDYKWKPSGNEVELWDNLIPIATLAVKWCEVMWYSGLKDKNDKEIYEGDIVLTNNRDKWKVIFSGGCFGVADEDFFRLSEFAFCEVIGNIWENDESKDTA